MICKQVPDFTEKDKIRFFSKIQYGVNEEDCDIWIASLNHAGYGRFQIKGGTYLPHRIIFKLNNIELPIDMEVNHRCSNKKCLKLKHLEIVTTSDNMLFRRDYEQSNSQKLNKTQIESIKIMIFEGKSIREVAKIFGVHWQYIRFIMSGLVWKDVLPELNNTHLSTRTKGTGSIRKRKHGFEASLRGKYIGTFLTEIEAEKALQTANQLCGRTQAPYMLCLE